MFCLTLTFSAASESPLVLQVGRFAPSNRPFCSLCAAKLLAMPRSPTSSEEEMAQSFSDYSDDSASDSSREETIYETIKATAEPTQRRMDDIHLNSMVVRVLIPDLQQTVKTARVSL